MWMITVVESPDDGYPEGAAADSVVPLRAGRGDAGMN
jgi:hypothetical protein